MSADLQIVHLPFNRAGVRRFLEMSHTVYRSDRHWVAPLLIDALSNLSPRNPFYDHATIEMWVARRGGCDVGRVAAIADRHFRPPSGTPTAFFGFFESTADTGVSGRLFETMFAWSRAHGFERVLGPMNPSANDECGLLVEGFDSDPTVMMSYNPAYYPGLIEAAGFGKARDLLAYEIDLAQSPLQRLERVARHFGRKNPDLRLRPLRRRTLAQDLPLLKRIYNEAWEDNWGFTPMTEAEIDFLAGRLRHLLVEGFAWLAEEAGEPVGLLVNLPDVNQAIKPLAGRLLSRGLPRALPYLLRLKLPPVCRVLLLGVRPRFRRRGIETVLLYEGLKAAYRAKVRMAEAGWVLENNVPVRQTISHFGGRVTKVYRLYERAVV